MTSTIGFGYTNEDQDRVSLFEFDHIIVRRKIYLYIAVMAKTYGDFTIHSITDFYRRDDWCQFAEAEGACVYLKRLINGLVFSPFTNMIQIKIILPPRIHLYIESRYLDYSNSKHKI